jgi:single-strand DNA-binding protein
MSKDLNKCMFIGRLGQDPDIKYLQSGSAVCNISIAVGDDYKDKQGQKVERTEWVKCTAFGRLAEIMGEYLRKGSKVYIEGKFTTRKWQDQQGQDRYSTEINVSDMQMLDGRSDSHGAPAHQQSQPQAQQQSQPPQNQQAATPNFDDFDEDIPFVKFMKNNEYLI